jgi:hypothetical protein
MADEVGSYSKGDGAEVVFRKGTVSRRVTNVVQSDARNRLQAAAQRIIDSDGARDFDQAFRLAVLRNPELADCLPDQMEDTSVDITDTYPNRVDVTPRNRSQGGNRIRKPYD